MALSINDNSQAVGASGTCANSVLPPLSFGAHAVLWDADGTAHDLGNLGSKVINVASSINNQGQVAGISSVNDQATPAQGHHAFLWTSAAGMQDLGTLPGDVASVGTMIGDAGDVVGESDDASGNPRAILWRNGVMHDLNDLAPGSPLFLLCSLAINSRGEIAGFGATENGDIHAYLATPSNAAASESLSAESRPATLSEDVRKLVRERLPVRRF
jgi:probable HAF family extracellular repeat protein